MTHTAVELAGSDRTMRALVRSWIKELEAAFKAALDRAIAEGDLANGKNTAVLASYPISSMQGLIVMGKAGASRKALHKILQSILAALE